MRELTQEEINITPTWATHYVINEYDDDVIYESVTQYWWKDMGGVSPNNVLSPEAILIPLGSTPSVTPLKVEQPHLSPTVKKATLLAAEYIEDGDPWKDAMYDSEVAELICYVARCIEADEINRGERDD